ncbi:MAG TPA: DUF4258 domain-containing protein [Bacteroidia bacterium]|nr:DUF4258 domain-containing protein [Bacteroidia bacterium]
MNFGRRIQLYLFGFFLGALIVWFGVMKNRPDDNLTSWLPKNRIVMQLDTNKMVLTGNAGCRLNCQDVKVEDLKELIKHGQVNFSQSQVHETPCPRYAIEVTTKKGKHLRLFCGACAAETRILGVLNTDSPKDSCTCP